MSIASYPPLNTLKAVGENIWIADGEVIRMDIKIGSVPFSTRMTIVRLEDGSLWCHSPIKANDQLIQEVKQLGQVKHLVSPNKIHYAYIPDWQAIFPQALAWASPGVEERAASQKIAVKFDLKLENQPPLDWQSEIDQLIFPGSRVIEELVFFHRKSKTLILTDLIENFETQKTPSRFWRMVYHIAGIADPDGKTPLDMRMTFMGNKKVARQAYQQMLAWQPDKIILAHGRWYDKDGVKELERAFRWLK